MKYDYTVICNCGSETYYDTLGEAKAFVRNHFKGNCVKGALSEAYINRHFKGSDIDDTFRDVKADKKLGKIRWSN